MIFSFLFVLFACCRYLLGIHFFSQLSSRSTLHLFLCSFFHQIIFLPESQSFISSFSSFWIVTHYKWLSACNDVGKVPDDAIWGCNEQSAYCFRSFDNNNCDGAFFLWQFWVFSMINNIRLPYIFLYVLLVDLNSLFVN